MLSLFNQYIDIQFEIYSRCVLEILKQEEVFVKYENKAEISGRANDVILNQLNPWKIMGKNKQKQG